LVALGSDNQVNVIDGTSTLSRGFLPVVLPSRRPLRDGGNQNREESMTAFSRRSLLAGAAALTVAGSVNAPVRAAAPMAGKQGPSFYRYKIGEFEVTTLNEGVVRNASATKMAVNKILPDI